MTLTYEATLDDIAEPMIRHYLRSKTAQQNRKRSAAIGAVIMAIAFFYIFRERQEFAYVAASIGALIGAAINFSTYVRTVKRRIRKHIQTENGHRIPNETIFTIEPDVLRCESFGVKIEFPLCALKEVSEDSSRIELSFGDTGLCTIPIRAFHDASAKVAFLDKIEANKAG